MTEPGWTIAGADGQPIIGDAHQPSGDPRGVVLVAHGFKGYKDYGMFPRIAATVAGAGFVAHRFNFSHSGMTQRLETFERPDLFERDTWNRQVFDLCAVAAAVAEGRLAGTGLPVVLFGHSRGGATALLAAGRHGGDGSLPGLAGVATAAAPSALNSLLPDQQAQLLRDGFLESPSSRTGQALRIGRAFLTEQLADPAGHDLLAVVSRITCPVLVLHGSADPTVPVACARQLAGILGDRATLKIIEGADHVFNTPNPLPEHAASSAELTQLLEALVAFATKATGIE